MPNNAISHASRAEFLDLPIVSRFVTHVASLLRGQAFRQPHSFPVRDRRVYDGYPHFVSVNGVPQCISISTLEHAYDRYWWAGENFDRNAATLLAAQAVARQAIKATPGTPEGETIYLAALDRVLEWGAGGKGMKLYTSNMAWATRMGSRLGELLASGVREVDSTIPNLRVFAGTNGVRMNAGLTKFFALACKQSIIYDGRVGAAMGMLVREFCKEHFIPAVPDVLAFRWANQTGENPQNRDPSQGQWRFSRLNPSGSEAWATWNVRANWVLSAALEAAGNNAETAWCGGHDGLRRVEAALFVIGYQMPQDAP